VDRKKMLVVPAGGEISRLFWAPVHLSHSASYNKKQEFPCNLKHMRS
jgi:hypothetical protein